MFIINSGKAAAGPVSQQDFVFATRQVPQQISTSWSHMFEVWPLIWILTCFFLYWVGFEAWAPILRCCIMGR